MSVYSHNRNVETSREVRCEESRDEIPLNKKINMEGRALLKKITPETLPACFFDPQYRGVMDKLKYGNEGSRQQGRARLEQMSEEVIWEFIRLIDNALMPSGHLFLWIDKFHLCEGINNWLEGTSLATVDLITWNKQRMGMGYRTRRKAEYLLIAQKEPRKAKGVWTLHNIPDVWDEKVITNKNHAHPKPINLQEALIQAVTDEGDTVVDPAAGTFSVFDACKNTGRNFLGCDLTLI